MAKLTNSNTNGTSFHQVTFKATVNQLILTLGEPHWVYNTGEEKVNFEWNMETEEGDVFTAYDWKEYKVLDLDEVIEWHIGAHSKSVSNVAKEELEKVLNTYVK
jgi:hypothetical protein